MQFCHNSWCFTGQPPQELADSFGIQFMETSAKNAHNVEQARGWIFVEGKEYTIALLKHVPFLLVEVGYIIYQGSFQTEDFFIGGNFNFAWNFHGKIPANAHWHQLWSC